MHRRIEWPRNTFIAARAQGAERDLVLLDGTEPNLKWRTYSETVVKVAEFLKIETVVVLGSLIAEVAHTLPVPITGLASDERATGSGVSVADPRLSLRPGRHPRTACRRRGHHRR